jgi:hypothetical protein
MAYAKSIGQLPCGRLRTSPFGVKQNTSSVNRSTFTVSRNSRGSFKSCCHSISWRSQANFSSSPRPEDLPSL